MKGMPWEHIGHIIKPNASVEEMLDAAGLNWEVIRAESYLKFEHRGKKIQRKNPKCFGLVRSDNYHILSPYMGGRYKAVQNQRAFEVFQEFTKAGSMTMETAGSIHKGKHIWGLASTGHGFELASGERIESYFLLMQSHLYGHSLKAMWTPVRYPGGHTLVQNITTKGVGMRTTYTMSHASEFTDGRIEEIHKIVNISKRALAQFQGNAKALASTKWDEATGVHYLLEVFNEKYIIDRKGVKGAKLPGTIRELMADEDTNSAVREAAALVHKYPGHDLASCDGTAWGYYNTVAHGFDTTMGKSVDTRIESTWLGKNRQRKQKALKLAVVMMGM
jgi:phage/plasmid-like protein (TIGR03299 family)